MNDTEILDWMQNHWSVEFSVEYGQWRAHLVTGSLNDREWHEIASGYTLRQVVERAKALLNE